MWARPLHPRLLPPSTRHGANPTPPGIRRIPEARGNSERSVCSYGTGKGFLDEAGSSLVGISCPGTSGNGPQQNQNWAIVPQVQLDVDHWMAFGFAAKWASQIWTAYATACGSKCPPLAIPSYDGPHTPAASSVYAGMATVFAGHSVVYWMGGPTAAVNQDIINHDGNMPVIVINYAIANPDSFVLGSRNYHTCSGLSAINCQATQAQRGSTWVAYNSASLRLQNPAGKYATVGFEHWSMWIPTRREAILEYSPTTIMPMMVQRLRQPRRARALQATPIPLQRCARTVIPITKAWPWPLARADRPRPHGTQISAD